MNNEQFAQNIIVSVPLRAANENLAMMAKTQPGLARMRVVRQGNSYAALAPNDPIPVGVSSYIDAGVLPQFVIGNAPQALNMTLEVLDGHVVYENGTNVDLAGSSFQLATNIALVPMSASQIAARVGYLNTIGAQGHRLKLLAQNGFVVNQLAVLSVAFDPTHSRIPVPGGGTVPPVTTNTAQLSAFFSAYVDSVNGQGAGFVAGYCVTATANSVYAGLPGVPAGATFPAALRPVAASWAVYPDPSPDLSSINFIVATPGAGGSAPFPAPTLDANPFTATDDSVAAMACYSAQLLTDPWFLEPTYNNLASTVWNQIKDQIDVSVGNEYAAGCTATDSGYSYTISNVNSGDDQYVNQYTVAIENGSNPGTVTMTFAGEIYLYKQVSKNLGVGTATAWASGTINWNQIWTLSPGVDTNGVPQLDIVITAADPVVNSDTGANTLAKAVAELGALTGGLLDLFSGLGSLDILSAAPDTQIAAAAPDFGPPSTGFSGFGAQAILTLILPGGFQPILPPLQFDTIGNITLAYTYPSN